jgi:hypothetical protein
MPHLLGFLDQRIAQRSSHSEPPPFAKPIRVCTIADRLLQRLLPILKPHITPQPLGLAPLAQEQVLLLSGFVPGRFFLGARK